MDLQDKVAIVTGGSSGIGLEIALLLAQQGAKIVLTARTESKLNAVRNAIIESGGEAVVVAGNVTEEATAHAVRDAARESFGSIDVLVNNVGYGPPISLLDMTVEQWDTTVDTCLKSVYLMTRAVLPTMLENNSGRIVQISSLAGKNGYENRTAYCAAKFGMRGFTEALNEEISGTNIHTHIIHPAAVATAWWENTDDAQTDDIMEGMVQPEEIAEAVLYVIAQPDRLQIDEVTVNTFRSPWAAK